MAKELTKVEVCGADGCAAITGQTNLQNFGGSGEPDGSAAAPAPFYEIRYTDRRRGRKQPVVVLVRPVRQSARHGRRANRRRLGAPR